MKLTSLVRSAASALMFAMLTSSAVLGAEGKPASNDPPKDWKEWAAWVEKLQPVGNAQGHGPDVGSNEWSHALDKRLKIGDGAGHGPDLGSEEWRRAVEKKLLPEKQRQLLASHDTVARFTGLIDYTCRGRTALCPDKCGHSGKQANFEIVKYLRYEKPGQYGDAKQEKFQVLIEDNLKNVKVPAAIRDSLTALKAGDLVRLQWNHDYVTQEGARFPERPIVTIKPLTQEEADKLKAE